MSLISIANSFLCENRAENGNKVTSAKESSLSFFYTTLYYRKWAFFDSCKKYHEQSVLIIKNYDGEK